MAGTNGKPKFQPIDRENQIHDLKIDDSYFYHRVPIVVAPPTYLASQLLSPHVIIPESVTIDTTENVTRALQQKGPLVQYETWEQMLTNPTALPVTVTLNASWNIPSFTLPPNSVFRMIYMVTTTTPNITFAVVSYTAAGSSPPGPFPSGGGFPSDFQLEPNAPEDIIVRNLADTAWVPSGTTNGGRAGYMRIAGSRIPAVLYPLDVTDSGAPFNDMVGMARLVQFQQQSTAGVFDVLMSGSATPTFGTFAQRDVVYRSNIFVPGAHPNAWHFLATNNNGTLDVAGVNYAGNVFLQLAAGPAVTAIGINAANQICAFP